jgi:hypothetical protein
MFIDLDHVSDVKRSFEKDKDPCDDIPDQVLCSETDGKAGGG